MRKILAVVMITTLNLWATSALADEDSSQSMEDRSSASDAGSTGLQYENLGLKNTETTISEIQDQLNDPRTNPPPFIMRDQLDENQAAPRTPSEMDLMQTSGQPLSLPEFRSE